MSAAREQNISAIKTQIINNVPNQTSSPSNPTIINNAIPKNQQDIIIKQQKQQESENQKIRLEIQRSRLQAAAQRRVRQTQQKLIGAFGGIYNGVSNLFGNTNNVFASIPSPGDIWTPFWILLFIWLILIPVNRNTRIFWLWKVLIGSASIGNQVITTPQSIVQPQQVITTNNPLPQANLPGLITLSTPFLETLLEL